MLEVKKQITVTVELEKNALIQAKAMIQEEIDRLSPPKGMADHPSVAHLSYECAHCERENDNAGGWICHMGKYYHGSCFRTVNPLMWQKYTKERTKW